MWIFLVRETNRQLHFSGFLMRNFWLGKISGLTWLPRIPCSPGTLVSNICINLTLDKMLLHYNNARLFLYFLPLRKPHPPLDAHRFMHICISSAIAILNIANERLEEGNLRFSFDYSHFIVFPIYKKLTIDRPCCHFPH